MERKLLFIADTHIASSWGLFPDNFMLSSGNRIELNPLQVELLKLWNKFYSDSGEYDTIILMGDIINGNNRKEFSRDLITPDLNQQAQAAIKLLKPFFKKHKNVIGYAVSSSGYHGSLDTDIDKTIIEHFNGKYGGAIANLNIKGTGKILHIRHGRGTLPQYISSKLEREIQFSHLSEKLSNIPNTQVIALAHYHTYKRLDSNGKVIFTCPCFEAPRINMYSSSNWFKLLPDFGGVKLIISPDSITVEPHLYKINLAKYYTDSI